VNSQRSAAARLFDGPFENINLIYPLLLFPLAAIEILFREHVTVEMKILYYFSATVLLTGGGHAGLTFVMLGVLPEGREWVQERTLGRPWLFVLEVLAVIVLSSIFGFMAFGTLQSFGLPPLWIAAAYLWVDWYLTQQHILAQAHGLMMAYRQKTKRAGETVPGAPVRSVEIYAKNTMRVILTAALVGPLVWSFPQLVGQWQATVLWVNSGVLLVAVGFYVYLNLWGMSRFSRNHLIFSLRLFLLPIMNFSFFAPIGYRSVHGIEYVMVYGRCMGSSSRRIVNWYTKGYTILMLLVVSSLALLPMIGDKDML
jgi:hypothetical protein